MKTLFLIALTVGGAALAEVPSKYDQDLNQYPLDQASKQQLSAARQANRDYLIRNSQGALIDADYAQNQCLKNCAGSGDAACVQSCVEQARPALEVANQ